MRALNQIYGLEETTARDAAVAAAPNRCDPPYVVGGDHDGDGLPNTSDPCPLLADPASNTDSDGDGIGDACDPVPGSNEDCLILFEDFLATDPGCWRLDQWSLGCGDEGRTPCSPTSEDTKMVFERLLSMSNIQISGEILDVADTMQDRGLTVYLQLDENSETPSGKACGMVALSNNAALQVSSLIGSGGLYSYSTLEPVRPYGPGPIVIAWDRRTGVTTGLPTQYCTVTAIGDPSSSAEFEDLAFSAGGRFALRANGLRFRTDLIVGYGRGRQCTAQ